MAYTDADLKQAEAALKAADEAWTEARAKAGPGGPLRRLNIMISEGFNNPSSPDYSLYLAQKKLYDDAVAAEKVANAAYQAALANFQKVLNNLEAESPTQPQPPVTASGAAAAAGPAGPTAIPAQQVDASGQVVTPPATTTPTNATPPATTTNGGGDSGLDAPTRTLEQTQATSDSSNLLGGTPIVAPPAGSVLGGLEPGEFSQRVAPTSPGVGANDNNVTPTTVTTQTDVNAETKTPPVKPQPNVLDKYASYTYSASVYLVSGQQYRKLINSTNKKIDGYQLLFQSGGAPASDGIIRPNRTQAQVDPSQAEATTDSWTNYNTAGRNPFFNADFYIDSITLETAAMGKGTGSAHLGTTLKFTVVEPHGITLLNRLYKAVQNFTPTDTTGKVNYTSAVYLMVIRFYGYDQDGNLIMPIRGGLQTPGNTSDSKAVVEKFIPFHIRKINWGVSSKMVTYEWDCAPVGQNIAGTTSRGTIPYDVSLTNTTVGGLLKGAAVFSTTQPENDNPGAPTTVDARGRMTAASDPRIPANAAPPPATAAPSSKQSLTQGLMDALNQYQLDLVKRGIYTFPDEYEIEFVGTPDVPASEIEGAKLQLPNQRVDKSKTAGGVNDANSAKPETNAVNMTSRSISITAGQQILQVIEQAIRNSSYIANQSLVITNPDGSQSPSPNVKNQPLKWFNIIMSAEPKPGGLDPNRNDNAYKIKYTVTPYRPAGVTSKYFPTPKFPGIHKSYPYWFTGKNTAVLDYQETLNGLFNLTMSGTPSKNSAAALAENVTSSMQEIIKYTYAPASNETRAGADGKSLEPAANAAEVLYNPGDLASTKLRIVGDPAWIQQGSLFKPLDSQGLSLGARTGFEPDGSVSFDSQDILFEVVWQIPDDYNLESGLSDPYATAAARGQAREPLQSRVYRVRKVISEFRNGKFEQTLDGGLYTYPKADKSNTANPAAAAAAEATADASDNRFARQGAAVGGTGIFAAPDSGRLGEGTSTAGAGRSSPQFAATDPRRLDIGDGGKAAVLGAQKSLPSGATLVPDLGQEGAFGNPSIAQEAALAADIVENAPPPRPPTSPAGGTVAEKTTVNAPPKLPGVGPGQSTLTPAQQREVNRRAIEQTNRELAEEYEPLPGTASPTRTTIPNNQRIARER